MLAADAVAIDALSPDAIARHLAERGSLTYAALFVACLAIGMSVWLITLIREQHLQAREDFKESSRQISRLADAVETMNRERRRED